EVTLRLPTPLVISPADANKRITWRFVSAADDQAPWQILGADDNPFGYSPAAGNNVAGFGGNLDYATIDGVADQGADMAVAFAREMDTVTGLTVTPQIQPLTVVDPGCPLPADAIPTGIRFHRISWDAINSPVVAGWGYYEVQRRDTTMPAEVWETIGTLSSPMVTTMDDYEARVGVQSLYRVRMVHAAGIPGPWTATVPATVAAPGVTGTRVDVGVLIFTSNHNPDGNLAYVNVTSRGEPEEFTFPEGGQTDLQQMYGRDFQVAFRPTERVGVEFTRTLMVNSVGVPTQTLDRGFTGLRDLAWDALPYVCVRDELDNRWLATILVPSATVQRVPSRGHLELARVTVVQVTDVPAPVDRPAPCEGLAVVGNIDQVVAQTAAPERLSGLLVASDSFTRTVAGGWGSTAQGMPWDSPAPAQLAVNGSRGTHSLAAIGTAVTSYLNELWVDGRIRAQVGVSALATGAPIGAAVIARASETMVSMYRLQANFGTSGQLSVQLVKRVGGVDTQLASQTIAGGYTTATVLNLELDVRADRLMGWAWPSTGSRPVNPTLTATATELRNPGWWGTRSLLASGNTNAQPVTVFYDEFAVRTTPADIDVRMLLRPSGETWQVAVAQIADPAVDPARYWSVDADEVTSCIDMSNGDFYYECVQTSGIGAVRNRQMWLRWTYDSVNPSGGGQSQGTWWVSTDGVAWTSVTTLSGPVAPFQPSSAPVQILAAGAVTVGRVEIRDGINGPLIASPDFGGQPGGTTSFTDGQGNVWTVSGRGICAA
ncbi:hypothetical protein, partial [Micromonospora sp. WMMC273]